MVRVVLLFNWYHNGFRTEAPRVECVMNNGATFAVPLLSSTNRQVQEHAAGLFINMTFEVTLRDIVKKTAGVKEGLEQLAKSTNPNTKKNAASALSNLLDLQ